ncbi:MAG: hypothetical protein V4760_02995 [Bdellovibrionota bacterium]
MQNDLAEQVFDARERRGRAHEKMRLDPNGSLILGSASVLPGANKLEVHGGPIAAGSQSNSMGGEVRLYEGGAGGSNFVAFRAPNSVTNNTIWTLPATDGTSLQVLQTLGNGTLQWAALPGAPTSLTANPGSAASPSVSFSGNTGSGLFSIGTSTLGIAAGGSERMRIESSGNVGIGSTTPGARLDVYSSSFDVANPIFKTSGATSATTGNVYAKSNMVYAQPASPPGSALSVFGSYTTVTGNNSNLNANTQLFGGYSAATTSMGAPSVVTGYSAQGRVSGTINATSVPGARADAMSWSTGNVSTMTGLQVSAQSIGGGSVNTMYGIKIDTSGTATSKYGIYQNDAAASNVFMGPVAVGLASSEFFEVDPGNAAGGFGGGNVVFRGGDGGTGNTPGGTVLLAAGLPSGTGQPGKIDLQGRIAIGANSNTTATISGSDLRLVPHVGSFQLITLGSGSITCIDQGVPGQILHLKITNTTAGALTMLANNSGVCTGPDKKILMPGGTVPSTPGTGSGAGVNFGMYTLIYDGSAWLLESARP